MNFEKYLKSNTNNKYATKLKNLRKRRKDNFVDSITDNDYIKYIKGYLKYLNSEN